MAFFHDIISAEPNAPSKVYIMNPIKHRVWALTVVLALGAALGYQALGQRAIAPAAPVVAVVRINVLFDQLRQRADARIDLLRLEQEATDERVRRTAEITRMQADLEEVVSAVIRENLSDKIAIKTLQLQFWYREAATELEVEKALLLQDLYKSMRAAIDALAQAEGYDLVLIDDASDDLAFDRESQTPPQVQVLQQIATRKILYRNPALDITLDLAERMNNAWRGP